MTKVKSLFICNIYNLKITEDLGDGIEIWQKIKITNNKRVISSLLTDSLIRSIGNLEANAIQNAEAIFYSIDSHDINKDNVDDILSNYLASSNMFLNDLWNIKDHCIHLMMGFMEFPYLHTLISLPYTPIFSHSNSVSGGHTTAKGEGHKTTEFSKKEMEETMNIFRNDNVTILPFSETSKKSTLLVKGMSRTSIASILVQTARTQKDLGLKISHYSTALEALFSSDSKELSHKLSERVAFFLENEPIKRKELFKKIKRIYAIRSKIMHGSTINETDSELEDISIISDEILRRIFIKLKRSPELDNYFRKNNDKGFEEYMTNLILGI